MKLTCEREKFWHAFQMAAGVVPSRSPKAILQNIKLDVTEQGATLLATDLEVGIRIDVSGFEVESPGSILLPVTRFGSILRESSDEKLLLESDDGKTLVRGQQSEFQLPSENAFEYPDVGTFDAQQYHELSARFFREMIHRTVFATDMESSRYALGGVLIELTDDRITAVATDGRRLAKQEGPAKAVEGHSIGDATTVIPSRALQLMERALTDCEEDVRLAVRENSVLLKSPQVTIYSGLVQGRFPKWRDVFPKHAESVNIELAAGPFHAAVRQSAIVTSEEHRGVDFTFGEGKIVLAGHGAELGESHVELPIAYDGPPILITLDPRFLADFLKVLDPQQTFTLELKDGDSAAVGRTDDGYGYVIMPLARES